MSDPTERGDIADVLISDFIGPVLRSWTERPAPDGVSLLLPGDPGTRKTTLVEALARAIGWPILTLTPPVFLRGGLERFEAEAAAIFRDLQRLQRVVVFFDECEEFFRRRQAGQSVESRTSGAFITAGMLPRLQNLHDRRNVVFVVATNAAVTELDPAAIRPGRFDRRFGMFHPRPGAQSRYLRETMRDARAKLSRDDAKRDRTAAASIGAAVEHLGLLAGSLTAAGLKDNGVPFNVLDSFRDSWIEGNPLDEEQFLARVRTSIGMDHQ